MARKRTLTLRLCALAALTAGAVAELSLMGAAAPEEAWRSAARHTARFAFLVFMPVYAASAWHRLAPSTASRWVLSNRRALGLAFATAHFIHLGVFARVHLLIGQAPAVTTLVGGGGAYVMLLLMTLTSNDAAVRRLGATTWKRLHTVGIHWLWFIFAFSYAGRVASGAWSFIPLLSLALAGLGMRIAARVADRRVRRASN